MNPQVADPVSLDRLHDIVLPEPASWWPLAPAWYALAFLLFIFVVMLTWILVAQWRRNAYRRAGLRELARIESHIDQPDAARSIAELVKRVALTIYPRERVASLTGDKWLSFLDASAKTREFTTGAGRRLEAGYEPGMHTPSAELIRTVRHWIKHHRANFA